MERWLQLGRDLTKDTGRDKDPLRGLERSEPRVRNMENRKKERKVGLGP